MQKAPVQVAAGKPGVAWVDRWNGGLARTQAKEVSSASACRRPGFAAQPMARVTANRAGTVL
jgi:hypothetical protein